jgi:hypothetical protein
MALFLGCPEGEHQAILLTFEGSGGIDQNSLTVAEKEGVGVGGGEEGGGLEGQEDDAGEEFYSTHWTEEGLLRVPEAGQAPQRTLLSEHLQDVQDGWGCHDLPTMPAFEGLGWFDPLTRCQFTGENLGLNPFFRRPMEEKETVVKTTWHEAGGEPPAGEH